MSNTVFICGPRRGRYGPPIPIPQARLRWVDDYGRRIKAPDRVRCEGSHHSGRRVWFARRACFVQRWTLTDEELKEAMEEYDMMSLDMRSQILCPACADRAAIHEGHLSQKA